MWAISKKSELEWAWEFRVAEEVRRPRMLVWGG